MQTSSTHTLAGAGMRSRRHTHHRAIQTRLVTQRAYNR